MSFSPFCRLFGFVVVALAITATARAQLAVEMELKRHLFMTDEPILATVTVVNQTGRDVVLADTEDGGQWFSFHIATDEGRMIPPRNPHYELEPLQIKAGDRAKRTVNLTNLFPVNDFGSYRIKTSIFLPGFGKYFSTKLDRFDVMDGHSLIRQTVGVPDGMEGAGSYRQVSLLTMEGNPGKMLYIRVAGTEDGKIYGCYNLGRMVDGIAPDLKFDGANTATVLHLVGPKTYLLSRVDVNGGFLGQNTYVTPKSQPFLRRTPEGALQIVGAVRQDRVAEARPDPAGNGPKVSDRPPGF